jgi:hypothetical protein
MMKHVDQDKREAFVYMFSCIGGYLGFGESYVVEFDRKFDLLKSDCDKATNGLIRMHLDAPTLVAATLIDLAHEAAYNGVDYDVNFSVPEGVPNMNINALSSRGLKLERSYVLDENQELKVIKEIYRLRTKYGLDANDYKDLLNKEGKGSKKSKIPSILDRERIC